jgi:hypothetical protein
MNRKIAIQAIGSVGLVVGFVFAARESATAWTRALWYTNKLYVQTSRHSNSHSDRQPTMNSLSSIWKWCTPFSRFTE